MNFSNVLTALKATRKFHKAYGTKGSKYVCRQWCKSYVVEVWQPGVNGLYFATLI